MLGDIVHNEDVVAQVKNSGIKKIRCLGLGKDKILLIRAHGASLASIQEGKAKGYEIVDATCPMVKEIHTIVKRMEKKGYRIIVIGDKHHDEVLGILGQLKHKAIVIDNVEHIPINRLKKISKGCVVAQSTQNIEKVLKIVSLLKTYIKRLRFFNTICVPTKTKQEEIRTLPLKNDVMVIIGSKTSANTKRLYEISKTLNPRTYWIGSGKDIDPGWFKAAGCVGVTAGASTPEETTKEVIARLKNLKNAQTDRKRSLSRQ
jgi:4-hydroxy-3-methylbut-2-en-1-yl diphosphate reductase